MEIPPVSILLSSHDIPHRVFQHHHPIRTLEQAAEERGQKPEQVIRSILFRLGTNEFLMVLVAGPSQIPWARLRKLLNQNRLSMASDEQVHQISGYLPGAVSPIGIETPLRILADRRVFLPVEISLGSGQRGTAIIMASQDLFKIVPNLEIVDLFSD